MQCSTDIMSWRRLLNFITKHRTQIGPILGNLQFLVERSGSQIRRFVRGKNIQFLMQHCISRVLVNSISGVVNSNFLSLTPTFYKVSIEKYSKTPLFSGRQPFYSYFQNPSENSEITGKCFICQCIVNWRQGFY